MTPRETKKMVAEMAGADLYSIGGSSAFLSSSGINEGTTLLSRIY